MSLTRLRDLRKVAPILFAFVGAVALAAFVSPVACYYLETPTRNYPNAAAAQSLLGADNFVTADLPNLHLPPTATRIAFTHNIDTEEWWLRFSFSPGDTAGLLVGRRPLPPDELREVQYYPPPWLRGWPENMSSANPTDGLLVYVDVSGRATGCLAVDWSQHAAFAWRCRHRAT